MYPVNTICLPKCMEQEQDNVHYYALCKYLGWLTTVLYNKRDEFSFPIVNFPIICRNLPAALTYRLYISQLIRYSGACYSQGRI